MEYLSFKIMMFFSISIDWLVPVTSHITFIYCLILWNISVQCLENPVSKLDNTLRNPNRLIV